MRDLGHLGTSLGVVLEGRFWCHSGSILRSILDLILGNLIKTSRIAFTRPWVGSEAWNMTKYRVLRLVWWGTGIAPSQDPPSYTTPGTPPPHPLHPTSRLHGYTGPSGE